MTNKAHALIGQISKLSLTQKFVVGSFAAILVTGVITGFVLTNQVRAQFLHEFANRTVIAQRMVIAHDLKPSDFEPGSARLAQMEFDRMMKKMVLPADKDMRLVKIWRADGTILYSTDRSLIGKRSQVDKSLERVFAGELVFKEDLNDLTVVYSPISFDGNIVGVFESYFLGNAVASGTRRIAGIIAALLAGGLAYLWFGLSWLVKGASRTIDNQNSELKLITNQQANTIEELKENYLGTMRSLATAVEARDPYTSGHSMRVTYLSFLLGQEMKLSTHDLWQLQRAAALHDIGKIGTPDGILMKPTRLSCTEWREIREHPAIGAKIVTETPSLEDIAPIIRHHHESFGGGGYPDSLSGARIPLAARILTVADAFDAMTSDRPYRKAFALNEALRRLEKAKKTQFDPEVVNAFLALSGHESDLLKQIVNGYDSNESDHALSKILENWSKVAGY